MSRFGIVTDRRQNQCCDRGNKQKIAIGKWLGNESEILILDCPARGIDIGVKTALYQFKQEGKLIIIISEELPELIGMSDRIMIMKDGRIMQEFERTPSLTESQLIKAMI